MHLTHNPSLPRSFARGAIRRCPRCGSGRVFRRWVAMRDRCPRCGLVFEREEGYWLGAVAINLAVTESLSIGILVAGIVLTWPDPPWTTLLVVLVAANIVIPVLFHPFSRTLWVAMERNARRWEDREGRWRDGGYPR